MTIRMWFVEGGLFASQMRFAICSLRSLRYFLKKLKWVNIFPWKFYTLR